MEKKFYEKPEMAEIEVKCEGMICASLGGEAVPGGDSDWDD